MDTWMRHPSFPAGQAALIPAAAVPYWTSRGWVATTPDTLGKTPAPPLTLVTITKAGVAGTARVPAHAAAFWQSLGWTVP